MIDVDREKAMNDNWVLRSGETQAAPAAQGVPHTMSAALFDGSDVTLIDTPQELRGRAEAFFGAGFAFPAVWLHPRLGAFGCRALAGRRSIFFAPGEFQPDTASGRALLFHELAHVFQLQRSSTARRHDQLDDCVHGRIVLSPSLEAEADRLAVLAGTTATLPRRFRAASLAPDCQPSAFLPVLTVGNRVYRNPVDIATPALSVAFDKAGLLDEQGEFKDRNVEARMLGKLFRWVNHPDKRWFGKAQGKVFDNFDDLVRWLKIKTDRVFKQNTAVEKQLAEQVQLNTAINKALKSIVTQKIPAYLCKISKPSQATWQLDNSTKVCSGCGVTFTMFNRRHHCRACGKIFCDGCTQQRAIVVNPVAAKGTDGGMKADERVCDGCFKKTPKWLSKSGRYSYFYCRGLSATLMEGFNYLLGNKSPGTSEMVAFISDMAQATSGAGLFKVSFPPNDLFNARPVSLVKQAEEFDRALRSADPRQQRAYDRYLQRGMTKEEAAEKAGLKPKKAKRSDFNVDINHPWVMKAIQAGLPVGAGPSSTTNIIMQFIDILDYPHEDDRDEAKIHVALAMFSFWRTKKSTLEKIAAIHTWNEVLAALQLNLSNKQWLYTDPEYDNGPGEPFFLYPARFRDNGLPEYTYRHSDAVYIHERPQ